MVKKTSRKDPLEKWFFFIKKKGAERLLHHIPVFGIDEYGIEAQLHGKNDMKGFKRFAIERKNLGYLDLIFKGEM